MITLKARFGWSAQAALVLAACILAPSGVAAAGPVHEIADGAAEERDCSHLQGRLRRDCQCKAALPAVRAAWAAGEVMVAAETAEQCDKLSPGLDKKDRTLLEAVHASANRVRTGLGLAREGRLLEAVSELSEVFVEAEKVPETPAGHLLGPLAYAQCRWWVLAVHHETAAGMPPDARTVSVAERVGQLCSKTLSDVMAGNATASCQREGAAVEDEYRGSTRTASDMLQPKQTDEWSATSETDHDGVWQAWPPSAGSPVPWLVAARLTSCIVAGNPTEAVGQARSYGAALKEGGLSLSAVVSQILAPAWPENSTAHSTVHGQQAHDMRVNIWDVLSLLVCRPFQGLRLGACDSCAFARISPLFSVSAGVPVLTRCGQNDLGVAPTRWRILVWRRRSLSDAFRHPVLASVWGKALALDCLERFQEGGVAGARERRRCLVQAREATQHFGSAEPALIAQAVHEFESGMMSSGVGKEKETMERGGKR